MVSYQLKEDIQVSFRDFHTVRAKKGSKVTPIRGGGGVVYYALTQYETDSPTGKGTIFDHDITYFYIWAPEGTVEEIP